MSLAVARALARRLLPLEMRGAVRRWPAVALDLAKPRQVSKASGRLAWQHVQCERSSPLRRRSTLYGPDLQRAKERNVALAAQLVDGCVIAPGSEFRWHQVVGAPIRLRGFLPGPELHGGELTRGPGGGLCQVANLVCWRAVHAGMERVERHRHDLELYPDHERTAPFGSGATVFFPTRDLRFRNPLDQPLLLELWLADCELHGRARFLRDPGLRWEVVEVAHRFARRQGVVFRENRLVRRCHVPGGGSKDEPLAENRARVAYVVPEDQIVNAEEAA